jgi:hypothetical protein
VQSHDTAYYELTLHEQAGGEFRRQVEATWMPEGAGTFGVVTRVADWLATQR